ncbi:DUF4760 domain-containing protein [Acidipila rosea]|uniref:Uncharacterized protein n=1 Tax=Acidipila rosea TaxID=768535 RepID=A0A4V2PVR8_9BACT|nr:hypothetical protein [Acidipila rosea]MBW4026930.1 hypothetical protein [Acidobacteriota bacterium]MBW4044998.1 hypothetical protein [Acidobacteriota bacterium]TCK75231.1 hypothetical protein C7378_0211 [Acidipila rosea]
METNLATNADAQLILKLYELRTEETMRAARNWAVTEFWPSTADDVFAVLRAMDHPRNAYLRQVLSYWEMAASFVLHGALNAEMFLDCNGENLFLYAKLQPLLPAIREQVPELLAKTGQLLDKYPEARRRVELIRQRIEVMRAKP